MRINFEFTDIRNQIKRNVNGLHDALCIEVEKQRKKLKSGRRGSPNKDFATKSGLFDSRLCETETCRWPDWLRLLPPISDHSHSSRLQNIPFPLLHLKTNFTSKPRLMKSNQRGINLILSILNSNLDRKLKVIFQIGLYIKVEFLHERENVHACKMVVLK